MHFIVSWDIKAESARWLEIDRAMREGIRDYSWIHPLPTFYILKVYTGHDWNTVRENLLGIAETFPDEVNFVVSPLYDFESDFFLYHVPDKDFCQ